MWDDVLFYFPAIGSFLIAIVSSLVAWVAYRAIKEYLKSRGGPKG